MTQKPGLDTNNSGMAAQCFSERMNSEKCVK